MRKPTAEMKAYAATTTLQDAIATLRIGLKQEESCYAATVNGSVRVAEGQSPSDTRRRAVAALESLFSGKAKTRTPKPISSNELTT